MVTAVKHPVPDRVKPSFVIFDIRALWRSAMNGRYPCFNVTALFKGISENGAF